MGPSRNPLPTILFTIFLDMLGYGILIPVLPILLADPQSPFYLLAPGTSVRTGYILLGLLIAAFPLAQFLATPILGQLSDRYGRKKILTISLGGTCFSYVLFALGILARNVPLLFFARLLDGLTGGNVAVAQAAISDLTPPEHRTRNFGLIGAAFGLGFIIGPFLGGKLADSDLVPWFNAATPFWFAAILSFINILLLIRRFPETNRHRDPTRALLWNQSLQNLRRAFTDRTLRLLFSTAFLFHCGFSFFTAFISVFLIHRFGFDEGGLGDFFAAVGIWIVLTQGFVTRRVSRWFREPSVLRVSLLGCGAGVLCYFLPTARWQVFWVVPFFSLFSGLSQANLVGLISRSAQASVQGEILGINASVQAMAQAIPPVIAGFLAAGVHPTFPMAVSGATILAAGTLFIAWGPGPRETGVGGPAVEGG